MSDPVKAVLSAGNPPTGQVHQEASPEPEPKTRRRFTKEDKLRILRLADGCTEQWQLSALLSQEGISSSRLSLFRRQFGEEEQTAADSDETKSLRLALEEVTRKLKEAEDLIEIQKQILISERKLLHDPELLAQQMELEEQNIDWICASISIRRAFKQIGLSRSGLNARKKSKAKKTGTQDTK